MSHIAGAPRFAEPTLILSRKEKGLMKIEDLVYKVVLRVCELLEKRHHYKIPEKTRKEVAKQVRADLNELVKEK